MRVVPQVLDAIAEHARESAPEECCGILLASPADPSLAHSVLRARNAETERPRERYLIGHEAQLAALDLECEGMSVVAGYYHSHPAGVPRASAQDARDALEGASYLIVGLGSGAPEFAAWRRKDGGLVPEPLGVVRAPDEGRHPSLKGCPGP